MLYYYWELKRRIANKKIHALLMTAIRSNTATMNSEGCLVVNSEKTLNLAGFLTNSESGEILFEVPSEAAFVDKKLHGIALRVIDDTPYLKHKLPYSYVIVHMPKADYLEIKQYLQPFIYKIR